MPDSYPGLTKPNSHGNTNGDLHHAANANANVDNNANGHTNTRLRKLRLQQYDG